MPSYITYNFTFMLENVILISHIHGTWKIQNTVYIYLHKSIATIVFHYIQDVVLYIWSNQLYVTRRDTVIGPLIIHQK